MSTATTVAFTKSTALLNTHLQAGHADPSHPKYPKFLKDLRTHLTLTRRFLYAIEAPASEREKLSYLVNTLSGLKEHFVSEIGDLIQAAADNTGVKADQAVQRVIDLINSDRTESNEQKAEIADLKAKGVEDAALIQTLRDEIAAGTITPEAAKAVVDSLEATNAKLADLDSDPLTPV